MSDELEDKESKTEEPTPRKLEKALEKGQVAYSKELTSFFMLLALCIITTFIIPYSSGRIGMELKLLIEHAGEIELIQPSAMKIITDIIGKALVFAIPIFIFIILIIIFSAFMQHGQFLFATDQLTPKLERISLQKGFERLFSLKSIVEFLKGIFKVILTASIIYFVLREDLKMMPMYPAMGKAQIISELYKVIRDILVAITIFMLAIGIADFFYQKYEHNKNLKMSRKEIKDEFKQTEGSPEIKKKQRQLMRENVKQNISESVPKADVVITNPEHYSVALSYDYNKNSVPIIEAKGLDHLAFKIREIAEKNDIPILEDPPLARALYLVEVGQEIPTEHYEAVAEIISYVYKLKNKKVN